jgi:hypothetical protein
MKTLLISGGSYDLVYSEMVEELKNLFSVDEVINLSSAGTSPDRQIRVVIEWIAQNGNPDTVIMPVSHYNRFDLPIADKFDNLHNLHHKAHWTMDWIDTAVKNKTINDIIDIDTLKTFIKTGAIVNQIEHTVHDYLFVKLLTFQAYLQQNKIRHLIFDTGNYYEKLWVNYLSIDDENNSGYQPGMKKRDLIAGCAGIYKFFSFCSNVWMYEQIIDKDNHHINYDNKSLKDLASPDNHNEIATIHHNKEETIKLMKFLIKEKAVYEKQ